MERLVNLRMIRSLSATDGNDYWFFIRVFEETQELVDQEGSQDTGDFGSRRR